MLAILKPSNPAAQHVDLVSGVTIFTWLVCNIDKPLELVVVIYIIKKK
jgi:hypothetical protein